MPRLGKELAGLLYRLAITPLQGEDGFTVAQEIDDFCGKCVRILIEMGLSDKNNSWLWIQGPEIIRQVENVELRKLNLLQYSIHAD